MNHFFSGMRNLTFKFCCCSNGKLLRVFQAFFRLFNVHTRKHFDTSIFYHIYLFFYIYIHIIKSNN